MLNILVFYRQNAYRRYLKIDSRLVILISVAISSEIYPEIKFQFLTRSAVWAPSRDPLDRDLICQYFSNCFGSRLSICIAYASITPK